MQTNTSPVTAQEIEVVKGILARMQEQGQSLFPEMWNSRTMGAMTDSSKRLRDFPEMSPSDDESLLAPSVAAGSAGFELIHDNANEVSSSQQKPLPPKSLSGKKPPLPEGVGSIEKWGMTICSLPKVKEASPTYYEIGTMTKYAEYRNWVFQHGESKGPRCVDLRNYLICSDAVSSNDNVMIPGTSEVRRFRE
eukprot:s413_g15.t1